VAWSPDLGYARVDPQVRDVAARAARRFEELGCAVEEPRLDWPNPYHFHKTIYEVGQAARQGDRALERPDWIEPTLMRMIVNAGRVSAIDHARALMARSRFYEAVLQLFDSHELLLTPQMPVGAWSVEAGANEGAMIDGEFAPTIFDRCPFTYPFNLTGQPAITVPCGSTADGLPVGLQIVGRWHAETTVLRAAACFEALQPWAQLRPPLE
jgi:Asp-tRNA(Asn)/Glu-tRNA(Gln) amidotransferase A subunit family amidase